MRSHLERFFVREWQRVSAWQIVLRPVSWIFSAIVWARRRLYSARLFRSYQPSVPVLVVGNVTVGGTGKTPVVLAIADYFRGTGRLPGIVTRGYTITQLDADAATVLRVNQAPANADSRLAGDEARLLARRSGVPVYAGSRRSAAVAALLCDHPNTGLVVGDDGLQHYAMARDVEVAVVDGLRGFGNGQMLPAGPLREPVSRLNSVDCIVLNQTGFDTRLSSRSPPAFAASLAAIGKPVFVMTYGNERFVALQRADTIRADAMVAMCRQKRIAAVAAIGNPARFFLHLETLGIAPASKHVFADHHAYDKSDFADIDADIILMTEKDAVKCDDCADNRMWAMQIDALLPDAFYEFIQKKIDHVTRPKAA